MATVMSQACTPASRAHSTAATGVGSAPCGSGVGTVPLSSVTVAQAAAVSEIAPQVAGERLAKLLEVSIGIAVHAAHGFGQ